MRRNKYNAKPTVYDGVRYDSKAEAEYAELLDKFLGSIVRWWHRQVTITLGVPENKYRVDFVVGGAADDGALEVYAIDVKGFETPKFRRDAKLWARYGPYDLKILKNGKVDRIITGGGQE